MIQRFYVGNLPYESCTDADLRDIFDSHGEVKETHVVRDHDTQRPKGFCFVEIETDNPQKVVDDLDGSEVGGRNLRVNFAEARPEKRRNETRRRG